jgi:hypothetical protein
MLAHENVHSHTMYYEGSTLRAIGGILISQEYSQIIGIAQNVE